MGVVSGAAAEEGGQVTGIIPYAIHAAGGEKDKCNGVAKSDSVAETLDEKRRGRVRDFIIRHTTQSLTRRSSMPYLDRDRK
jgi:hypothetical protein